MNDSQKTEKLSAIKEFLFKDYDFSDNTLKVLTEFNDRWFRFYIIMVSAVGSALAYLYTHTKIENSDLTFSVIAGLLLLVLFLAGTGVLLIEFRIRIRAVECFNAINRIRKYFVHKFIGGEEASEYLEYPYKDTDRQKVFEWKNVFKVGNIICFVIIMINTVVGSAGAFLLSKSFNICLNMLPQLTIALFLIQVALLIIMYEHSDQSGYRPKFPKDWPSSQETKNRKK